MRPAIYQTLSTPSINYLLDSIGVPIVSAYSLRRLSKSYKGAAIKVRRSSDNNLLDIGFIKNDLDINTLQTFCGSGNGFVDTWYDQSGGTNHVVQSNINAQPRLVNNGVVYLNNNKPSLLCETNKYFNLSIGMFAGLNSASEFAIFRQVPANSLYPNGHARVSSSPYANHCSWNDTRAYVSFLSLERPSFDNYKLTYSLSIHTSINNGNSLSVYKNGSSFGSNPITFSNTPSTAIVPDSIYGQIDISEYIILGSADAQVRPKFEANMADYYQIPL
jgi:Alpha-L-arabinofuranosidase B, catalytic